MKIAIVVMTCPAHAERDQALRDTWLSGAMRLPDVSVALVDGPIVGRHRLAEKFYNIVLFAHMLYKFDSLISVDNDTLFVPRLEYVQELAAHDCMGHVRPQHHPFAIWNRAPYPHGSCFSLSSRAMQAVIDHPEEFQTGVHDTAVGRALKKANIELRHSGSILIDTNKYQAGAISVHPLTPTEMRATYASL